MNMQVDNLLNELILLRILLQVSLHLSLHPQEVPCTMSCSKPKGNCGCPEPNSYHNYSIHVPGMLRGPWCGAEVGCREEWSGVPLQSARLEGA
jgi:hypothetical protein